MHTAPTNYIEEEKIIVHSDGRIEKIYIQSEIEGIREIDIRGGTMDGRLGS